MAGNDNKNSANVGGTKFGWWKIGWLKFVLVGVLALIVIWLAVSRYASNGQDLNIGPNDYLPTAIENYNELTPESRLELLPDLEKLVSEGSTDPDVHNKLINAYITAERFEDALSAVEALEDLLPNEARSFYFYVMATEIAVWANDSQVAGQYLEKVKLAPDEQDGMRDWEIDKLTNMVEGI